MTKLELNKINKLEYTEKVVQVDVSRFIDRIIDNEIRPYNKHNVYFDYNNRCLLFSSPYNKNGVHDTLVLSFEDIINECQRDVDEPLSTTMFEFGLYCMNRMKDTMESKIDDLKDNIKYELEGFSIYD